MPDALAALRERLGTINDLERAGGLLGWDQATMMPEAGQAVRAHQMGSVAVLAHQLFVSDETGRLIAEAEETTAALEPGSDEASLVRVTRRDFDRAQRVPADLAGEMAEASATGYARWTEARERSDFGHFLPSLERNVELALRYIDCFEPGATPYDVLIDIYEPGVTAADITPVFATLKPAIQPLIDRVVAHSDAVDRSVLARGYPVEGQKAAVQRIAESLGADPVKWRLDETVHPFAFNMGIDDIRLTTRFAEDDLAMSILGTIHEFGHGLYEAQIDSALERTPLANGCSMTLHESQSRLWENMVGRSRAYWDFAMPALAEQFPSQLGDTEPEVMYRAINHMEPSLVRVEADQLTYGYHIILRYELEIDLVEGRLKPADLPEAWNGKMRDYLGVDVPTDALGVLQDVHWSAGSFGYFPTYLLGSVLSVQIWDRMVTELGDVETMVRSGEFAPIRDWLREHVHRYGRKFTPLETIELAAGGPLDAQPYIAYLTARVNEIYNH